MHIGKRQNGGEHPTAKQQSAPAAKPASQSADTERQPIQPLNYEQQRIVTWLKKVRFRRTLFGGVSENDVWKKIDELNSMYDIALRAERARYDALLESRVQASAADPLIPENEDMP